MRQTNKFLRVKILLRWFEDYWVPNDVIHKRRARSSWVGQEAHLNWRGTLGKDTEPPSAAMTVQVDGNVDVEPSRMRRYLGIRIIFDVEKSVDALLRLRSDCIVYRRTERESAELEYLSVMQLKNR